MARTDQPNLVILDRRLPGLDGLEVSRRLRAASPVPILMLTAASEEIDKVLGLSLGAGDYVAKPFSPREVIARVKAILSRAARQREEKVLRHRDLEVDLERHRVSVGGKEVDLTASEFKLLHAFMELADTPSPRRFHGRRRLRVLPPARIATKIPPGCTPNRHKDRILIVATTPLRLALLPPGYGTYCSHFLLDILSAWAKGHGMRRPWFSGLRFKLMLLILFAVTPALGLTFYTGVEQRRTAASNAREDAIRLARLVSTDQLRLFEGARVLLVALARLPEVRSEDPSVCSGLFADLEKGYRPIINLGAAKPNGDVFCSALPFSGPVNVADRAYFRTALQTRGFAIGDYQIGRVTGKPSVNVGYPVLDSAGQVRAVVFAAIDLAWFSELAAEAKLPEGAVFNVIDHNGTILARYPAPGKWVGRSLPDAPIVQAVLTQEEGTAEVSGVDGIARIYAFTPLGAERREGHAHVAVGIPKSVVFAEVSRLFRNNLVGLTLILLLGFGMALLIGRLAVLRVVDTLVLATSRLRAGDLSARTGLHAGRDELGHLASAFDEMAAALQRRAVEAAESQKTLAQYADRLAALHEIDQAILSQHSPEAIAQAALEQIGRLVPCRRASVGLFDFAANAITVLAAHGSIDIPVQAGTRVPLEAFGDVSELLRVLREGKTYILDMQSVGQTSPLTKTLLAAEIRFVNLVPLLADGQLIGSLNLIVDTSASLSTDHIDIAREVADQLAVAIQQADFRQQLQRHAEELEQRVAQRTTELQEAVQAADRANQAKSEFLSRMSHELRTPLNAILGFAQLLEMDSLTPEQRESVGHVLKAGRHLLELINEVLDLARIEAGRLPISVEPVSLQTVVQESLDLVMLQATEANIEIHADAVSSHDLYVLADHQRLKQVLLNLLANAIKYNRNGGTVTVSGRQIPQDRIRIAVTDTGVGIAPERLARLFTPFERLGVEQTGVEGTGLGLTLSKRLVEAMGGTLGVESTAGRGSTFWVELPRAEDLPDRLERMSRSAPPRAELMASSKARVVLYIEDNLSNLKLLQRLLAHRPEVKLLPAMQGRMGLDLAREHQPDLILLDLHLPDMLGDEVLWKLQATPETSRIPVVVISADATAGQIDRLLAAGARAYLTKPLDVKKCLDLLDEILNESAGSHARRHA